MNETEVILDRMSRLEHRLEALEKTVETNTIMWVRANAGLKVLLWLGGAIIGMTGTATAIYKLFVSL